MGPFNRFTPSPTDHFAKLSSCSSVFGVVYPNPPPLCTCSSGFLSTLTQLSATPTGPFNRYILPPLSAIAYVQALGVWDCHFYRARDHFSIQPDSGEICFPNPNQACCFMRQ